MTVHLTAFTADFTATNSPATPINSLWNKFKLECMKTLNTYVPSKMTSSKHSQPCCNRIIRRLTKRRAYKKARLTKSNDDWNNHRANQQKVKKQCKAAYDTCVKDIVTEDNSKKLFIYVKSRKCDGSGLPL